MFGTICFAFFWRIYIISAIAMHTTASPTETPIAIPEVFAVDA